MGQEVWIIQKFLVVKKEGVVQQKLMKDKFGVFVIPAIMILQGRRKDGNKCASHCKTFFKLKYE